LDSERSLRSHTHNVDFLIKSNLQAFFTELQLKTEAGQIRPTTRRFQTGQRKDTKITMKTGVEMGFYNYAPLHSCREAPGIDRDILENCILKCGLESSFLRVSLQLLSSLLKNYNTEEYNFARGSVWM
jgi:hypothetical protein